MALNIQLRRDSAAHWTATNPILAEGELCIELDSGKMKIGDGINHWNDLPYFTGGVSTDKNYVHDQAVSSDTWVVTHNMGKFPAVTVVDSAGTEVEGSITHDSTTQTTLSFSAPFAGKAHFN